MTGLSDFPPDIAAAAQAARDEFFAPGSYDLASIIARTIVEDRARRPERRIGGLTAHQKRVFGFVASYAAENGISPSYDEIQAHFGLASKSGVHRVVHELAERGAIALLPNRARAITIIATPPAGA